MNRRTALRALGAAAIPGLAGCATYDRASDRFNRMASGGILTDSYDATSGFYGGLAQQDDVGRDETHAQLIAAKDQLQDLTTTGTPNEFIENTDFSRSLLLVVQFVDRQDAEFSVGVVRRIGDGIYRVGLSRRSGTSSVYMVHSLMGRLKFESADAMRTAREFSVYYRGTEFRLENPEAD